MKKDKIKIVLIAVVLVLIFAILLFKSIREKGEKVVSFNNKDEIAVTLHVYNPPNHKTTFFY